MARKIIPEGFNKKQKTIPIDHWTAAVDCYVSSEGNAKLAYAKLEQRKIEIKYREFLSLIHEGDEIRNLPPIQSIYVSQLQKAVTSTKASMAARTRDTLELADAYKDALKLKVALLQKDPDKITRNIGAEIRHIHEVEAGAAKILIDDEERHSRPTISADDAKRIKAQSMKALSSKAAVDDDEDDAGLGKIMRLGTKK